MHISRSSPLCKRPIAADKGGAAATLWYTATTGSSHRSRIPRFASVSTWGK